MKKLDTRSLRRTVTFFIALAMIILAIAAMGTTALIQKKRQNQMQEEYAKLVQNGVNYVIDSFTKQYTYYIEHIVKMPDIIKMLKNEDREALYRLLKPKWELMRNQEKNFKVMNVYLSDGTTFLRMQNPTEFGDNQVDIRPMIKEQVRLHTVIVGYENAKQGALYRIISPLFDENNVYIGAIEIGVCPVFILRDIYEVSDFCGLMLTKEETPTHFPHVGDKVIDGYKVHSELSQETASIVNALALLPHLEDALEIESNSKRYKMHLFELKDFQQETNIKIIFFQDITKAGMHREYFLFGLLILISVILPLLIWFIYRRIECYERDVSRVYQEQIRQLDESEALLLESRRYLLNLFDAIPNIMVTTDGKIIENSNLAMLDFFGYATLEDFKKEHHCVCEYFIEDEGCMRAQMNGVSWLEYIFSKQNELQKACMMKGDKKHSFIVWAQMLETDDKKHGLVVFNDITELESVNKALREKDEIMIAQSGHAAMGEMISMIAHQWRQPVSVVAIGAMNVMMDIELGLLDEKVLKTTIHEILEQTQELSDIIDDFREFFRPQKTAEEISTKEIIEDAFRIVGSSLKNSNIEIITQFYDGKKIYTYSRELMQVIINILKNAKEALDGRVEKKIFIFIEDQGGVVMIKICDNAGGIEKNILDKIFNPYFTTKGPSAGTGLGLYMSKTIVEKHLQGSLSAYNKDKGACFEIKVPYKIKNLGEKYE